MKIKKGFVAHQMGDKTVVVSTGQLCKSFHGMIELNSTGVEIWKWIEAGYTKEDIVKMLVEKYHIEEKRAATDLEKIIKKMIENGIFEDGEN